MKRHRFHDNQGNYFYTQPQDLKMDRISVLPIGIIEAILCFLPIKDAARTSILSREWRYRWLKIPKLKFIEPAFEVSTDETTLSVLEQTFDKPSQRKEMCKRHKLFYAIYQVLLMHQGPIHNFTLSMIADKSCVEIDHLLLHMPNKHTLNILKLKFSFGRSLWLYALPTSLFSLHQLTELYLRACALFHVPSFIEFGCLTTLYLDCVSMDDKRLIRLLSGCPLLKSFTLDNDGSLMDGGKSTIVDLFKCLPVIEYLSISSNIVECFEPERLPKRLLTTLIHLKCLDMDVCFSHKYKLPFFVLLIRSSPNLEKLNLMFYPEFWLAEEEEEDMCSFTLEYYSDLMFERLKEIEISCFSHSENELDFVNLVLAKSPVLKKVLIRLCPQFRKDEDTDLLYMLSWSPCASPMVKITVGKFHSDLQSSHLKMDRISKLPIGIIETILCFLPIREAARTSILSKKWRYHWTKIPKLKFIEREFQVLTGPSVMEQTSDNPNKREDVIKICKLVYSIYRVLRMHQGPIHEFTLAMKVDGSFVVIDRIIVHLFKKYTLKKLALYFNDCGLEYELPVSFFSLHQLTEVYLCNCSLLGAPSFYEFGCLTTLCLRRITTYDQFLVRFLSRCPLLKRLTLHTDIIHTRDRSIADLFECLPLIDYLSIWFHVVLSFIPERLPKVLPTTLVNLKSLEMDYLCFSHKYGLPFLILLIRSSPNLEKLQLAMENRETSPFDEDMMGSFTLEDYSDIMLQHLNELVILRFSDTENEVDFVKLVLAKSPVLKTVMIFQRRRCIDEDEHEDGHEDEDEDGHEDEHKDEHEHEHEHEDEDEDGHEDEDEDEHEHEHEHEDEDEESDILKIFLCSPSASPEVKIIVSKFLSNRS
ncbi:hypothetical protein QVD17_11221 [Tagetes erecta]|uniref:F-box domain-containing protein n=1 Tax=Tagetes erecta TaxID=13708 RepID=A0AAD8KTV6_TARER|nr:hypothetical protein QVD17_11221 [Tagetes erecta]